MTDRMRNNEFNDAIFEVNNLLEKLVDQIQRLETGAEAMATTPAYGPAEVATAFYQCRLTYTALDAATKRLFHVKDRFDKNIVPKRLEENGLDMIRVPELGYSFSVQVKTSASFLHKQAGFAWLRDLGQGDLITETVNAGTLSSFVKSLLEDQGIEPPDDVVKVSTYNTMSVNKYTPK